MPSPPGSLQHPCPLLPPTGRMQMSPGAPSGDHLISLEGFSEHLQLCWPPLLMGVSPSCISANFYLLLDKLSAANTTFTDPLAFPCKSLAFPHSDFLLGTSVFLASFLLQLLQPSLITSTLPVVMKLLHLDCCCRTRRRCAHERAHKDSVKLDKEFSTCIIFSYILQTICGKLSND